MDERGSCLEYGLFDVLAQPLGHAAHVIRDLVHALSQTVWQGLHCIGHVSHGASERIHKCVYLKAQKEIKGCRELVSAQHAAILTAMKIDKHFGNLACELALALAVGLVL